MTGAGVAVTVKKSLSIGIDLTSGTVSYGCTLPSLGDKTFRKEMHSLLLGALDGV